MKSIKFESAFYQNLTYADSLEIQQAKINNLLKPIKNQNAEYSFSEETSEVITLLGFEYPSTITLGKRALGGEHVHQNHPIFQQEDIAIYESSRGGQATIHTPGQLVIYPIFRLEPTRLTIRTYVKFLEEVTIRFFGKYGIAPVSHADDSGVFLRSGEKLAFIGLKIHQGITSHGIAINIRNQLELFDLIVSCGVQNRPVSSLQKLGFEVPLDKAFSEWCQLFEESLKARFE